MILFYAQSSPFARIARIAIREGGLTGRVEERKAATRTPDNPILAHHPLGRVPTLVDGDVALTDTSRIFAVLAGLAAGTALRQAAPADRAGLAVEGLALGMIETIVTIARELRRPAARQMPEILVQEREKARRGLLWADEAVRAGRLPEFPAFAAVALAAGLGYMELSDGLPGWRGEFPALADWYEARKARPSMAETAPDA